MSITKITLTAVAAAAFVAPTLTSANARQNDKNRYDRHRYEEPVRLGTRTPGIDRRIKRQFNRIRAGRRNGDLTFREARRLRRGVNRVRRARASARYDGNVTRYERRELHSLLSSNSQRIYRLRHNDNYASPRFRRFRRYINF